MAWTEYMEHVLEQLNGITAGTELENKTPQSLTIEFARDPLKAPGFNFASMAFNNHFFFQGINTDPHTQSAPSSLLTAKINDQFSSLDTLRAEFWTTAEAMFGPGFVWLVQVNQDLRILPTYIAGSPLSAAHYRRQSQDLNTHNADSYKDLNKVGQFGAAAKTAPRASKPLGGVDITPLLCVNTWEHVWLHDYGVKGKGEYLNRWWDKINWTKVEEKATLSQPSQNYGFERFTR
ncbi:manganese and iron superoxide dismutase [Polyplosphaeria fusca]|uniref:Manganese and iron superoxide dismutase n=1 Tax=Polyplosphaeria fusca TaxID=682080 RepID=A0A9P4V736_9PLEO|nr:manganese and iron superoxide dismutase [Polyplosphaeria fusca]